VAVSRSPIQIKNLTSGGYADLKVACNIGGERFEYPGKITIETPRFPKLITSAATDAFIVSQNEIELQLSDSADIQATKYSFVRNRDGSGTLTFRINSKDDIVKDGRVKIVSPAATPVNLRLIDQERFSVKSITDISRSVLWQLELIIPKNSAYMTTLNRTTITNCSSIGISVVTRSRPVNTYSVELTDTSVINNLEYRDDYRILPIFAYERRKTNSATESANKIMVTTSTILSDDTPPAITSLPAIYDCFVPTRFVQRLASNPDVTKTFFHIAIARYHIDKNGIWAKEWLQKTPDGKAIFKRMEPKLK
jgi:hypothetical protein